MITCHVASARSRRRRQFYAQSATVSTAIPSSFVIKCRLGEVVDAIEISLPTKFLLFSLYRLLLSERYRATLKNAIKYPSWSEIHWMRRAANGTWNIQFMNKRSCSFMKLRSRREAQECQLWCEYSHLAIDGSFPERIFHFLTWKTALVSTSISSYHIDLRKIQSLTFAGPTNFS